MLVMAIAKLRSGCASRQPNLGNINKSVKFDKQRRHASLQHLRRLCPDCPQEDSSGHLAAGKLGEFCCTPLQGARPEPVAIWMSTRLQLATRILTIT